VTGGATLAARAWSPFRHRDAIRFKFAPQTGWIVPPRWLERPITSMSQSLKNSGRNQVF
jgi:hypothetical protein